MNYKNFSLTLHKFNLKQKITMSWRRVQTTKKRRNKHSDENDTSYFVQTTPPKRRVFCNEYGGKKLLFETKGKALSYIKYNAAEIEKTYGYSPNRAYYCESCGGWHVTHKEASAVQRQTPTQRIVNAYYKSIIAMDASWQDVEYVGFFIDEEGKEKLKTYVRDFIPIPQEGLNIYLDHITLYDNSALIIKTEKAAKVMKQIDKMIMNNEVNIKIRINGYGIINGKVAAFRIATQLPSTKETLYITIGTYNDGKPTDSKHIEQWIPLENGAKVNGVIKKVYRTKQN